MAFVRHPLDRFISAYADKMLFQNWDNETRFNLFSSSDWGSEWSKALV